METLFENQCIYSKKNLLEMAKKTQKKYLVVINIFAMLICALNAFSRIVIHHSIGMGIFFLLCAGLFSITLFLPNITANRMLKQYHELYHSEYHTTTLFFQENMVDFNEQTNGKTMIEYAQIMKVTKTKGLYLLVMRQNLVLLIDKNGFIKGERAAFEAFIKEKAINAKIKL